MTQDEAKRRILARRSRFVAVAVASAGLPAGTHACGGNVETESSSVAEDAGLEACLSPPWEGGADHAQPCLGAPLDASDDAPQVCLSQPYDAGEDAAPEACLSPPEDAAPEVCLDVQPDASTDAS